MKEKLNEILESGLKKLDDVKDLTELEVVTKELTGIWVVYLVKKEKT